LPLILAISHQLFISFNGYFLNFIILSRKEKAATLRVAGKRFPVSGFLCQKKN
jgi:hypothetical protein